MKRLQPHRILLYILMTGAGLLMITPFYFMIITSLKKKAEVTSLSISLFVKEPTLQAYHDLLQGMPYLQFMWNSLVVAVATTVGTMFFCTLAGYAFSKHRFPGREKIFTALLATMMVPGSVLLVPGFLLMRDLGWLNTYLPLIVPSLAGAFGIFLSKQFNENIQMAGAALAVIPVLILFFILQKQIVKSLSTTGLKG